MHRSVAFDDPPPLPFHLPFGMSSHALMAHREAISLSVLTVMACNECAQRRYTELNAEAARLRRLQEQDVVDGQEQEVVDEQ